MFSSALAGRCEGGAGAPGGLRGAAEGRLRSTCCPPLSCRSVVTAPRCRLRSRRPGLAVGRGGSAALLPAGGGGRRRPRALVSRRRGSAPRAGDTAAEELRTARLKTRPSRLPRFNGGNPVPSAPRACLSPPGVVLII